MSDINRTEAIRVLTVMGTRPEAIKLAPVILGFLALPHVEHCLCVTGQHREMLDQVLAVFGIAPDIDLRLMRPGLDLTSLTAESLLGIQRAVRDFRPDWVIVQGDTTTAFSGALAAFYERIPVVHVEAGLRTGNLQSPWPEELNRRLITQLATLHCAPTPWAADNLRREGVPEDKLLITGNTVIDALRWVSAQTGSDHSLQRFLGHSATRILSGDRRVILVTAHRRENLEGPLSELCHGLCKLAARGDVNIVFPVHLNPNVQRIAQAILGSVANVHLTPPMDYPVFVALLKRCHLVITDSGGLQEEAPGFGKPVLVTRDTTERPEAVAAGTAVLVGTDPDLLVEQANRLLDEPAAYAAMAQAQNPYGDGHAAQRTIDAMIQRSRPRAS